MKEKLSITLDKILVAELKKEAEKEKRTLSNLINKKLEETEREKENERN